MLSFSPQTLALGLALLWASCGPGAAPGARAVDPGSFSAYTGHAVELFDDKIDAAAVGLATINTNPKSDPVLHERVTQAEAIARMRVSTVTVDMVGGQPTYHVSIELVASIVSKGFSENRVELSIGPSSPSFGIVKWLDTRIIGRTFVGFIRRFAGAEEPIVRFHLSADTADVLSAVREAAALADLKPL
jgi:hypothetical protein